MFTRSQKYAYDELIKFINSNEREIIITGSPGYGKSYLINELSKKVYITLTATTNKASDVIKGITTYSLLGLTLKDNYKTGDTVIDYSLARVIRDSVIVIDECSMITTKLYDALNDYAINCKLIYVGDYYQLPPVKDNFNIFDRGIRMIELTDPCRTDKSDILSLCSSLKNAISLNTKFRSYVQSDNIVFLNYEDFIKRLETFVPVNDKILAHTNDAVIKLNKIVRGVFGKSDLIGEGDYVLCKSVVDSYNPTRIEEMKQIKSILRNNRDGTTRITTYDGGKYNVFLDQYKYKNHLNELADAAKESGRWKPYFDFKNSVLDIRDVYAGTVHSSQGSTYNNVFIDVCDIYKYSNNDLMRLMYVAVSRAKEKVYLFKC